MKGRKKIYLLSAAVMLIAGAVLFAGNAVQSAKAAFSGPSSASHQINSAGVPELGVVELKGVVDAIAADSYTVSGLIFRFDTLTIISGGPAVGDSVKVKALTLPDLTRYALMINKTDAVISTPEFEFFGLVETMAAGSWTVSSEVVIVDLTTVIDPGIAAGALVEVKGTVVAGQMLASSIELKESIPGDVGTKVELFGTVDSITGAVYLIGGKTVNTDSSTEFVGTVAVGNFVKVHATLNSDGTYLAREIELISTPNPDYDDDDADDDQGEDEDEIKITGVLESMSAGLWVVNGMSFVVDENTKIEGDPQMGDTVEVEAYVQSDGTNLAYEIELEDDESVGDDDDSSDYDDDEDSDDSDSSDDDHDEDDDDDDDDNGGGSSGGSDDDDEEDDDSGSDSSGFTS